MPQNPIYQVLPELSSIPGQILPLCFFNLFDNMGKTSFVRKDVFV